MRKLKRIPGWGLGCAGAVAGVAQAADYDARAYPDELMLIVAVELCSLTFQVGDSSKSNLVAPGRPRSEPQAMRKERSAKCRK